MRRIVMVAFVMALTCVFVACAEVTTTRTKTTTTMNDNLGGIYFVDGIRHVAFVNDADPDYVERVMANYRRAFGNNVHFVYVEYSYNELHAIRENLKTYRDDFDIVGIGISEQDNTLRVMVLDLTDEIVEAIKAVTGLDDIIFEEGTYPILTDEPVSA